MIYLNIKILYLNKLGFEIEKLFDGDTNEQATLQQRSDCFRRLAGGSDLPEQRASAIYFPNMVFYELPILWAFFGSWFLWKWLSNGRNLLPFSAKAPRWAYFGGVFGALIVVLANITVNSAIGLVGSVSLMILGQTLFAMLFDFKGWLGMEKRKLNRFDFMRVAFILTGSFLIIFY